MTQTPPATPARPALPPELDPRQPGPTGPPRRRRRATRILAWLAVALSAVVLVTSVGLYVAFRYYNGRIARIDIRIPGHTAPPAAADGPAQNYLLVGSDTRAGAGNSQFNTAPGSPTYVTGQRSDTVILVHIPAGTAKATIISFPRDAWVTIPAYKDARTGTSYPAHQNRINSAITIGGPPLLIETVQDLSGLRIDHYVQIDFAGFQRMVNTLGGVDICVRTTRADKDSGDYLTAGTHHVNGAQALSFVRDRKGLPRGDLDRIVDQQYFLSVLLRKVLSAGTLANPLKINAFLKAATASVSVDRDLSFNDMRNLALRMRRLDPAHVTLTTVPVSNPNAQINGADVVLLDSAKMKAMFDRLKQPESTAPPAPAPAKLTVPPSAVSVAVYNAAGIAGLAAKATQDLTGVGFRATVGGNRGTSAAATVVRYGPAQAAAARTLAAAVPGATLQAVPSLSGLELVVGSGYTGARAVTVGAPTPAQPKPAASGAVSAATAAQSCAP